MHSRLRADLEGLHAAKRARSANEPLQNQRLTGEKEEKVGRYRGRVARSFAARDLSFSVARESH